MTIMIIDNILFNTELPIIILKIKAKMIEKRDIVNTELYFVKSTVDTLL